MLSVESVISYLHKLRDLALVSNNLKLLELISQSQAAVEEQTLLSLCKPKKLTDFFDH